MDDEDRAKVFMSGDSVALRLPKGLGLHLAAKTYARLPFGRGSFDRLIAAHALSLGLTFVTNNERDFGEIAGLRIESWTR